MLGAYPIGSRTLGGVGSTPRPGRIPAFKRDRARPVCLVEISLLNSGPTLYLSDRNATVLGRRYEDYLSDLSVVGEELRRADSEGLNAAVTLSFKNDRYKSYSYLIEIGETYPFEGAGCVIKAAWFDGDGTLLLLETVFRGVFDEPREVDLMGFNCSVSSMEFQADTKW
jgi:hypothetical protein